MPAALSTQNQFHFRVNLMVFLFLSLMTGCGESTSSKQKATKRNLLEASESISSCQLLSENEWASVLGELNSDPDETNRGNNFSMCSVSGANGSVLLMIRHPEKTNSGSAQELVDKLTKSAKENPEMVEMKATDYRALTDMEVPAAYVEIGEIQVWLECYKNETYLRVQGPNLEKAKAIAILALAKL
jgi:hypothetical protein